MGQSALLPAPRPIVLTDREDIGFGIPRTFTIPEKTAPGQSVLRMRLVSRQWSKVGGQNRSGSAHQGFDWTSGARVAMYLNFMGDQGETALPWSWNAHFIADEWGPTSPASPAEYIDPADWPELCPTDPTCYWGSQRYLADDQPWTNVRDYALPEDEPWYSTGKTPGARVHFVPIGEWQVPGWDGSHEWPYRIEFKQTTLLWLAWE